MRYRLTTIAYLFALVAGGFAALGAVGVFAAFLIFGLWVVAFRQATHPTLGEFLALSALTVLATALLLPLISQARPAAFRNTCRNNLKMLALGALNFESAKGHFPPAVVRSLGGAPVHSWRLAILPFMEQSSLYAACRSQLPWNHPANAPVTNTAVDAYNCPAHGDRDPRLTSYFAVVDDRTMWPPDRAKMIRDVTDGTSNTILFLEAPGRGKLWAQPEDLTFDEAVTLLTTRPKPEDAPHHADAGYFYKQTPSLGVAFADGSVDHLPVPLPRETAIALLTASGGEHVDTSQFDKLVKHELDYARCYALAMFAAIAVAPGVRLCRRGRTTTSPETEADLSHFEHALERN